MNEIGFSQARIYLLRGVGVSEAALWLVSCVSRGSGAITEYIGGSALYILWCYIRRSLSVSQLGLGW